MLRLLTRGSRMRELYLKYLQARGKEADTPAVLREVVEAMRSLVAGKDGEQEHAAPPWVKKKRFLRYRRALRGLDPGKSCA